MWEMPWTTLLLLILASYRLTRLIVFDQITSFLRRPFVEELFREDENGMIVADVQEKGGRFHGFMRSLLTCYWCVGVWASIAIVILYLAIPDVSFPVILVLALAGAAGIMESFVKG